MYLYVVLWSMNVCHKAMRLLLILCSFKVARFTFENASCLFIVRKLWTSRVPRKAGIVIRLSWTGEQVEAVEHVDGWGKQNRTQFLGEAPSQRQIEKIMLFILYRLCSTKETEA